MNKIKWLLIVVLFGMGSISMAVTTAPLIEAEVKRPVKKPPIIIHDENGIAQLNPDTFEVTYAKGVDPKAIMKQLGRAWFQAASNFEACNAELQKEQAKNKK